MPNSVSACRQALVWTRRRTLTVVPTTPTLAQRQIQRLVTQLVAEHDDNKSAVAKLLDMTDVWVGYIVRGERSPSEGTIDKVCKRLRLRREYLQKDGGDYRDYIRPLPARLAAWRAERPDVTDVEIAWLALMPDATPEWAWSAALALYRESNKT